MKNIVKSKTAKQMKKAGFRQPEPEVGQVWVEPNGVFYFIGKIDDHMVSGHYIGGREFVTDVAEIKKHDTFCPTATDILLDMPDGYRLTRVNQDMFLCTKEEPLLGTDGCKVNPAEAAALAWFETNEM